MATSKLKRFDAKECRRRNANAIRNTATGRWLGAALKEIRRLESELESVKAILRGGHKHRKDLK